MSQLANVPSFAGPLSAFAGGGNGYPQPRGQGDSHGYHFPAPSNPDTSAASYAQSVPASAVQAPSVAPQRRSASPTHPLQPNASNLGLPNTSTPPTKYPMAAPQLPNSPAKQHSADNSTNASTASPATPQSPGTRTLEQQRVGLLLSINSDLLDEANRLQAQGSGGATSEKHQQMLQQTGQDGKYATPEYMQCMRYVQANIAYLAPKAQQQSGIKTQPGPAYMRPPPQMPQLREKYEQLRELFPGWQGMEHRMSASAASPVANAQVGQANGAK